MYRTKLIGIKDDTFKLINVLRKMQVFHVIESSRQEKEKTYEDLRLRDAKNQLINLETRGSAILSRVESESKTPLTEERQIRSNKEIIKDLEDLLSVIEPNIKKIEKEKEDLKSKIEYLSRYQPVLRQCQPLIQEIKKKSDLESNIIMFNRKSDLGLFDFEKEIKEKTKGLYEIISRRIDENYFAVLLLYNRDYQNEIQGYLASEKLSSFELSPELRNVNLIDTSAHIESSLEKLQTTLESLENEKNKIIETPEFEKLVKIYNEASDRISDFQLAEKMGGTENTFEIEGFLPKSKAKKFESELESNFGNRILITKTKAKKDAPVLRKNPRFVRPFETITNLIQLPKYGSIDPTPLVFIFFTFYWGFMVGDVGYAIVIFLIAAILRMRFKKKQQQALQNITEIFMMSCVVAMFFGLIYFEIFGDLGELIAHDLHLDIHPILDRYNDVQELLILSIMIGYVIIIGGMFLGVYNNFKLRHMSHVYSNLLLILIWGSIPVVLIIATISPDLFTTAILADLIIILISIGILIKLDGIAGLIHVIERFSNILSFARLMAIGLVGAWMGKIGNNLTTQENIFPLGLFMGLGLHLINIVILSLSPTIHSMRLNVFEFFTQFVLEGGNTYKPYGEKTV